MSEASNLVFQSRVSFNSLANRLDWRSVFSFYKPGYSETYPRVFMFQSAHRTEPSHPKCVSDSHNHTHSTSISSRFDQVIQTYYSWSIGLERKNWKPYEVRGLVLKVHIPLIACLYLRLAVKSPWSEPGEAVILSQWWGQSILLQWHRKQITSMEDMLCRTNMGYNFIKFLWQQWNCT